MRDGPLCDAGDQATELGMAAKPSLMRGDVRAARQLVSRGRMELQLRSQGEERTNGAKMGDTHLMTCEITRTCMHDFVAAFE